MNKVLMSLAAVPFLGGTAVAGQPLTNQQMDRATAGFTAVSQADAQGLVGESGIVLTTTATLAEVVPFATATLGEASSTLFGSVSASQSSTVTSASTSATNPGLTDDGGAADGSSVAVGTNLAIQGDPPASSGTSVTTSGSAVGNMVVNSSYNQTFHDAGGVTFQPGTFVSGSRVGF
jgi:hypothetical protein